MINPSDKIMNVDVLQEFELVASEIQQKPKPQEKLYPISFRVTVDEKARIKADAGNLSISGYIRQKLLGKKRSKRKEQAKEVAQILSMFGQDELVQNILALNLAIQNSDPSLQNHIDEKIKREITQACSYIQEMKFALFSALGLRKHKSPKE